MQCQSASWQTTRQILRLYCDAMHGQHAVPLAPRIVHNIETRCLAPGKFGHAHVAKKRYVFVRMPRAAMSFHCKVYDAGSSTAKVRPLLVEGSSAWVEWQTTPCDRHRPQLSNGWALCPAWFPKVLQAAQHVTYVAVRAPARP